MRRDRYVAPPSSDTSTVAVRPSGASKSLRPTYTRSAFATAVARTDGWSMSARNACSVMVAGEKKSLALSSLSGKPGTFIIPAYNTGGLPPTAWVISAVIDWLGGGLGRVQESPASFETKMGAVVLLDPPGLGVKAEAARSFGFEAYSARNGSASCQVSPLSERGIRSTTRTPASLAGVPSRFGVSQATPRATPTTMTPAPITLAPPFLTFPAPRGRPLNPPGGPPE